MAIALLIIGSLLFLSGFVCLIYSVRRFIKDPRINSLSKNGGVINLVSIAAIGFGALFLQASINVFAGWNMTSANLFFSLFGVFAFAVSFAILWSSFALHYYKPKMEAKQAELAKKAMYLAIPFAFVFFLFWTDGVGDYLSYPLVSGFSINDDGWTWTTSQTASYEPLHIAFYGIIMLFGVFVCYWICDHRFYQEFHKHGILDNLVLVAFPAGVIGARIWYVIGNWTREGFDTNPLKWFEIWNGGLTIIGGAFGGIAAGIIFLLLRRKYVNVRWALDVCVPTILIAQAIGRWGNFLNNEVYGNVVSVSDGWNWLPNWIINQMNCINIEEGGGYLTAGQIHVPLFLIEGTINLAGYFIITYAIGKPLRKYLAKGDLAGLYFIWYGVTRLILEPLRSKTFNMGNDNEWSIWGAVGYIGIGIALIIAFQLYDFFKAKKDNQNVTKA